VWAVEVVALLINGDNKSEDEEKIIKSLALPWAHKEAKATKEQTAC
jgi:hypothetical protein